MTKAKLLNNYIEIKTDKSRASLQCIMEQSKGKLYRYDLQTEITT